VARRRDNPLALAVLTLLAEQPMHPYEMSSVLKQRRKEASIKLNYGSLYSVVESLRAQGAIEVRETRREGNRPERTVYGLTDAGRTQMTEWLGDLLRSPSKEYPRFEAALSLMPALPVGEVIALLEVRLELLRERHEAEARELERSAAIGMPRLLLVEHEYEQALLAAEIAFVAGLLDELHSGRFDGMDLWGRLVELRAAGRTQDDAMAQAREELPDAFSWLDRLDELDQPDQ
jgi:DNA-binding PadR family transcriptional regulator